MKKLFTIAFIGLLVSSCAKKPDHSLQDSNSMLQEPAVKVVDTTTAKPAANATATPAPAVKVDSAKAK